MGAIVWLIATGSGAGAASPLIGLGVGVVGLLGLTTWQRKRKPSAPTFERNERTRVAGNVRTTGWEEVRRGQDATVTPPTAHIGINVPQPHATGSEGSN